MRGERNIYKTYNSVYRINDIPNKVCITVCSPGYHDNCYMAAPEFRYIYIRYIYIRYIINYIYVYNIYIYIYIYIYIFDE